MSQNTPIWFVVLTMDYCSRTFGNAPCTATGEECFNTFPTCKDKTNYGKTTKQYKFTSADAPLPFDLVRPYVSSVKLLPTEIKTALTVAGRVTVDMQDELDKDVGIDPYVTSRTPFPSIPGTFWRKFLERNRNYRGRSIEIYEGWYGEAEGTFDKRWSGKIDNIVVNRSTVRIEAVDLLKDLTKIEVPTKASIQLNGNITATDMSFLVSDATPLPSSGFVKIDDEIIAYSARDTGTRVVTVSERGAYGTAAAEHSHNVKVGMCKYYASANAFDTMKTILLTDAGMPSGNVDSTGIDAARDFYATPDVNVTAIITEDDKATLSTLFFELVDLMDCKAWVAENLKVTVARNLPYDPARSLHTITDDANIIHESPSVDVTEKDRRTRVYLYWDRNPAGKKDEPGSYRRLDLAIDSDAESANEYNEIVPETIFCRWLTVTGFVEETVRDFARRCAMRRLWRNRDAMPILKAELDLKDEAMKTGDYAELTTDELQDRFGVSYTGRQFRIVRRERKGSKVGVSLQMNTPHKIGYIHSTASPNDWASATVTEKKYAYICANDATLPTDVDGYYIY